MILHWSGFTEEITGLYRISCKIADSFFGAIQPMPFLVDCTEACTTMHRRVLSEMLSCTRLKLSVEFRLPLLSGIACSSIH